MKVNVPGLADLSRAPERIVCIAPSNTEILYALGAESRIVGVSRFCDHPPAARDKPRCGGFLDPDVEAILALRPDLVLSQSFLQQGAVKALVQAEVRVLAFAATSVREILEDIIFLGRIVDREQEARALVGRMTGELGEVAARGEQVAERLGRRPRVYLEEWGPSEPYYAAGDFAADLLVLAGGQPSLTRNLRCPSPQRVVGDAEIAASDPDLIIAAWCGCGEKVDLSRIARRPGLQDSRAVCAGSLYVVDDRFVMRPGPRIVEGARRLQARIETWGDAQAARPGAARSPG